MAFKAIDRSVPGMPGYRKCTHCEYTGHESEFNSRGSKRYKVGRCKKCRLELSRFENKRYEETRGKRARDRYRKKHLGLDPEEVEAIEAAQGGRCAICKKKSGVDGVKTLCLDHNHKTGKVRGMLCRRCNSGLGFFQEDLVTLRNAMDYIIEHSKLAEIA